MKKRKILWESMHIDDIEDNSDFIEEDDLNEDERSEYIPLAGKLINTPMGMFDIEDRYNPLRQFEFRIGYTNFDIDEDVFDIIDKCEGVEAFHVLTRYRFVIGIGKLFEFEEVRANLESELIEEESECSSEAKILINRLSSENDYWCLYMFPSGKIDSFGSDNKEEYEARHQLYKEALGLSHGLVLTCED